MNRKNASTFLSFACLIVVICSTILPVFSLQKKVRISSNGAVNYPEPSLESWDLVVTVTPADGGSTFVSGTRSIPVGQSTSIVATPNPGYVFSKWLLDNTPSTSNPIAIPTQPAGSTHSLVAVFAAIMTKAAWLEPDYQPGWNPTTYLVPDALLNEFVKSGTYLLFLEVGEWTGLSITYWYTNSRITEILNAIRLKDSRFEIHAYVYSDWGERTTDITSIANRQTMINQAVACVDKGFDGYHDDLEGYTGSLKNYIDWLNGMSAAMSNKGKRSSAAIPYFWESAFPLVNLDYSTAMLYTSATLTEGTFKSSMNTILKTSVSPVVLGILKRVPDQATISEQVSWITEQLALGNYPKYVGASIFCAESMAANDWAVWTDWSMN